MKNTKPISSHKELIVWQRSMELIESVYELSRALPPEEKFGLVSQMRRSAVSVASNIAEGRARNTRKEFIQFLYVALGSEAELETQLDIVNRLNLIQKSDYNDATGLLDEVRRMLIKMISSLKARSSTL